MPSTRDIRRRIRSVKNTAQITKAMQLVAASKMKRAQDQATSGRKYAELMNKVLVNLRGQTDEEDHPLLQEKDSGRDLVLLVSTDKGLCGPLNTNLFRKIVEEIPKDAALVTVGLKGRQAMVRLKREVLADFQVKDPVHFGETKLISTFVMEQFLEGEYKTVKVVFTNFVNTLSQTAEVETLLPIRPIDLGRDKDYVSLGGRSEAEEKAAEVPGGGYLFEPTAEVVLDHIVPQYVNYEIYQMVLESRASEHSARMVAMKSATDNANQLVKDLTLEYNKVRQAAITNELLEITTAMKALE